MSQPRSIYATNLPRVIPLSFGGSGTRVVWINKPRKPAMLAKIWPYKSIQQTPVRIN